MKDKVMRRESEDLSSFKAAMRAVEFAGSLTTARSGGKKVFEERERRKFCSGEEREDLSKYSEEQSECPGTNHTLFTRLIHWELCH